MSKKAIMKLIKTRIKLNEEFVDGKGYRKRDPISGEEFFSMKRNAKYSPKTLEMLKKHQSKDRPKFTTNKEKIKEYMAQESAKLGEKLKKNPELKSSEEFRGLSGKELASKLDKMEKEKKEKRKSMLSSKSTKETKVPKATPNETRSMLSSNVMTSGYSDVDTQEMLDYVGYNKDLGVVTVGGDVDITPALQEMFNEDDSKKCYDLMSKTVSILDGDTDLSDKEIKSVISKTLPFADADDIISMINDEDTDGLSDYKLDLKDSIIRGSGWSDINGDYAIAPSIPKDVNKEQLNYFASVKDYNPDKDYLPGLDNSFVDKSFKKAIKGLAKSDIAELDGNVVRVLGQSFHLDESYAEMDEVEEALEKPIKSVDDLKQLFEVVGNNVEGAWGDGSTRDYTQDYKSVLRSAISNDIDKEIKSKTSTEKSTKPKTSRPFNLDVSAKDGKVSAKINGKDYNYKLNVDQDKYNEVYDKLYKRNKGAFLAWLKKNSDLEK